MSFSIDRQTLDELNLLGKFRTGSVYHLFGHVKTMGGEKLLDEMFRNPLTSADAINLRSSIFRFFQETAPDFPFDVSQVALMREYLDTAPASSRLLGLGSTMIKKILSSLTRDDAYRKKVQGLQAVIATLNHCWKLVDWLEPQGGPFNNRVAAVKHILENRQLAKLRNMDIYSALPVRELALFDQLLKRRMIREMEDILSFIYEIDVYISVSTVARHRKFSYAHALEPSMNIFSVNALRHPCLEKAVGNDLLMKERSNVLFLTGANMAGKSTLMKSAAIALYLAHMEFPVAAAQMQFSVREGLYTSINVADNINQGYSHFYAEVVRVKQAAEAAASGKRLMLMFDELFKGTNVKDAFDGTLAVTKAFAEYSDCLFVVSTHIIEVGESLRCTDNIRFVYMPTILENSKPRYTYRLMEGITEDRQGMMIIRNEGILEMIGS